MSASSLDRVAKVFAETLAADPGSITRETTPDDVEKWDSLGHMNLVAGLEEEFGIQFEIDDVMEMIDVSKILEILAARGAMNGRS